MIVYFFHFDSYRSPCEVPPKPTDEADNEPGSSSGAFPIDAIVEPEDAADGPQADADGPQADADEAQDDADEAQDDGLSQCPKMRETLEVMQELEVI